MEKSPTWGVDFSFGLRIINPSLSRVVSLFSFWLSCLTNSIVVNETASLTISKLISGLETGFWCPSETSLLPFVALKLYLVFLI